MLLRQCPSLRESEDVMKMTVLAVLVVGLAGCGVYHWTRPGASIVEFTHDHRECAREAAVSTSAAPDYGVVRPVFFRACMTARGWRRDLPPAGLIPAGWFRGVENEDIVKLDAIPPQP
jgi:hypothetical protein